MGRILPTVLVCCLALCAATANTAAEAGEKVVLRASNGSFLRADDQGSLRADRLFPSASETFEMHLLGDGRLALKAPGGQWLAAVDGDVPTLRIDRAAQQPGDRHTFVRILTDDDRVALRVSDGSGFVRFVLQPAKPATPPSPGQPAPEETIEIFRAAEIPTAGRAMLTTLIRGLVIEEIENEEYDKTRTRKIQKYIELPAPTFREPGRKKKHRILSTEQQYRVRARLSGEPTIEITHMPYLKSRTRSGSSLLMFVVHAVVPVRGHVRYQIPKVLSASTGFETVVELDLVGEVRAEKSDEKLTVNPPEVLSMQARMRSLDLSNDLLQVARRQIEDLLNHEIRDRNAKILAKANKAVQKEVETREFEHPVLRYLILP